MTLEEEQKKLDELNEQVKETTLILGTWRTKRYAQKKIIEMMQIRDGIIKPKKKKSKKEKKEAE
jgi:hypothetical protein